MEKRVVKKGSFSSLKFYMVMFLVTLVLLFSAALFYNNYTAFQILKKNIYTNTEDTLVLYQKNLDERLSQIETYLLSKMIDNSQSLTTLRISSMNETSWFTAKYQLSTNFNASLPSYTTNCFFCYLPEKEQYIQSYNTDTSTATALKKAICALIRTEEIQSTSWMTISSGESHYLVYTLNYFGTYIGSWCSMEYLLDSVSDSGRLYFTTMDGKLLHGKENNSHTMIPISSDATYVYEEIGDEKALVVSHPLETAPMYLSIIIPGTEISGNYQTLILAVYVVVVFFFLIWFLIFIFLRRYILKPVYTLTDAITQLRNGNLDAYIPLEKRADEFQNMSGAFNEMVHEIKDLKIDVYERKLQRQRLETQYLKQQITPHFMINCLNTVCQLTDTNHPDLAKQMLRELSNHLRYTLSSGYVVSLSEELKLTANYIALSNIRYPSTIQYEVSCPEELENATAIPLLILNFIENTVKYEVSMGEIMEIHVSVEKSRIEEQDYLNICIWDTGRGFSKEFLAQLEDLDYYSEHEVYHIGIVNTYLRAKHIYSNPKFRFSNREGAGAQISIRLPYIPLERYVPMKGEAL